MGTTASEIEKVLKGLEEQGCTVRKSKLGYRVRFPDGDSHTLSASTEPRAMRNQRAVVRNHGLIWPLDPKPRVPKLPSPEAKATIPTPPATPAPKPTTVSKGDPATGFADPFAVPLTEGERKMIVTPTMATAWLEQNTSNRKLTTITVDKYAQAMRDGHWHYDASPIRFAKSGRLLDGQHRLWAVIESDTSQEFLVVTGLNEHSFVTMDTGKKRSFADVISIEHPSAKDPNALASITVLVKRWEQGYRGKQIRPTGRGANNTSIDEYLSFFNNNAEAIQDLAKRGREIARKVPGITTSMVALLMWIFEDIDAEDSEAFFDRLMRGANLDEGSPILALRNFLYRWATGKDQRSALPAELAVAVSIKAWNAWRAGREVRVLSYRPGGANPESFPRPE